MQGLPRRVRVARRLARELPPARCGVGWIPRLEVPGAEGVTLLTDHYVPLTDQARGTILVRTPYGRGFPWAHLYGVAFAEQGFHVLLQSCRGTGGSTGRFEPFRNEAADGQATVAWLRGRDWFTGRLGTIGSSYLGYVQLALACDPPPELKAAVIQVGLHDPAAIVYPGGVFALINVLSATAATFSSQGLLRATRAVVRLSLGYKRAARVLPLKQACRQALGESVPYLEQWLDHDDPGDAYWRGLRLDLSRWRVPTALQGAWYDAVLDQTLAQYAELKANGCEVSLLVGPWSHSSAFSKDGLRMISREALAWMTERLAGDDDAGDKPEAPVRVHVGGSAQWRGLKAWPPHDGSQAWYLNGGGGLSRDASDGTRFSSFRYDPADPTPSVGGQLLSPEAGPQDNRAVEARPDVLVFTSEPLPDPLDVLGPVRAVLHLRASTAHAHVFVRLCDVDPQGRSWNVTDGILRLTPGALAEEAVTVPMSSAAHQFASGHRLRLQVSGGAHPRFARNTGTGEPLATATRLVPTDIEVYHDRARPSALLIPAADTTPAARATASS
ncbi:MAG: CocE/NonD family hydrolase [Streptosporangiaceae bacterium]